MAKKVFKVEAKKKSRIEERSQKKTVGLAGLALALAFAIKHFVNIQPSTAHRLTRREDGALEMTWQENLGESEQIALIMQQNEPVVIVGGPCSQWRALHVWSESYLSNHIEELVGVRRNKENSARFINENFNTVTQRAIDAGFSAKEQETLHNMTTREFFATDKQHQYFSKSILDPELDAVRRDVGSFQTFSVDQGLEDSFLWMAKAGIRAAMHYDTAANFNCQVLGTKRFILGHPNLWRAVRLFPSFHLSGRQSQIDITSGNIADMNANLTEHHKFYAVDLKQGDALFVPPYFLHGVETLGMCVNVNFFSSSHVRTLEKKLLAQEFFQPSFLQAVLDNQPRMFPAVLGAYVFQFIQAVKNYLGMQCVGSEFRPLSLRDAQGLFRDIVDSRYALLYKDLGCESFDPSRCPVLDIDAVDPQVNKAIQATWSSAIRILEAVPHQRCDMVDMIDIFLGDFVDATVASNIGFQKSCPFMRCLAHLVSS